MYRQKHSRSPDGEDVTHVRQMAKMSLTFARWRRCHSRSPDGKDVTHVRQMAKMSLTFARWKRCHSRSPDDKGVTHIRQMARMSLTFARWQECHSRSPDDKDVIHVGQMAKMSLTFARWQRYIARSPDGGDIDINYSFSLGQPQVVTWHNNTAAYLGFNYLCSRPEQHSLVSFPAITCMTPWSPHDTNETRVSCEQIHHACIEDNVTVSA